MNAFTEVAHTLPWFVPMLIFILGAIVGSFLNVCIYRIPTGRSVVFPGSHCGCGQPIVWHDNIPILSWILLRGRARCCGRPFSVRYPAIELLTAVLFLLSWHFLPPVKAVIGMGFISVLIVATFVDLDHMIIPESCTIWTAVAGVVLSIAFPSLHGQHHDFFAVASLRSVAASLNGLLLGSALLLWVALIAEAVLKKEAMGFGDIKFLGAIGAFTGWHGAVFAIFGGAIIGTLWFILALAGQAVRRRPPAPSAVEAAPQEAPSVVGFGVHVPFGPMLAAGALIYFLFVHRWVDIYFNELAQIVG